MKTTNKRRLEASSPIPLPPSGGKLLAALLTSYRPVSPTFMLAEVLPVLLQLERERSDDARIDALFVGETINALATVPGKITVITSASASEDPVAKIPWLNSYIRSFMVGRDADCVQHAKLWLSHWSTPQGEMLQITVSSTNLTADAFHGQIQAGWSVTLPIATTRPKGKAPHAALSNFLLGLGAAAHCNEITERFAQLLAHCAAVQGSHFVASVPGQPSPLPLLRSLAGAGAAARPKLRIMTPSIGNWNTADGAHLQAWCKAVGVPAKNVELIWPGADHAWAFASTSLDPGTWKMPAAVLPALKTAGVQLLGLPSSSDGPVFDNAERGDRRWSHAKFYEFNDGLLLGSHNWSKSAWGAKGTETPENFELSVFVENKAMPLSHPLGPMKGEIALMLGEQEFDKGHWVRWAQAGWDGKQLVFGYRLKKGCVAVAEWFDGVDWKPFRALEKAGRFWRNAQPCAVLAPTAVRLVCSAQEYSEQVFAVNDLRPGAPAPMGVSTDLQQLVDDILLSSCGAPPVAEPGNPLPPKKDKKGAAGSDADYTLEWLAAARKWRRLVDTWRAKSPTRPELVARNEATRLIAALGRRARSDIGAAIAQEELSALLAGMTK